MNYTYKSLIHRLFHEHIKNHGRLFFYAFLFMLLCALSTALLPYLLQPVFDQILTKGDLTHLFILCGSIFCAFLGKGIGSYGESVIMVHIGQKLICDIQIRLFSHLLTLDLSFFNKKTTGELISHLTNDVQTMRHSLSNTVMGLGRDSVTLLALLGVMIYRDPFLSLLTFVIFPMAVFPIFKLGKRMKSVSRQTQQELSNLSSHLAQVFQCIRVVKAYHQEGLETHRAKSHINKIFKLVCKTARVRSASHPIIEAFAGFAIISVIAYGGYQVMSGGRTTGEFISFIGALLLIYEPIKRLSQIHSNIQEGLACAERVFEIIDTKACIVSPINPTIQSSIQGSITFENVTFAYDTNIHKKALFNFNLCIQKGQSVALVGSSGSGKSTLVNLIPRFYDPTEGRVLIDSIDIKEMDLTHLRSHMALVSQEIALFEGSVFDNVAYATHGASLEAVKLACERANAYEFIQKLPKGLDTPIGENGITLSGGQRQRLAIARAILKDSPILLLDEATSALDTVSEGLIQQAIKPLMKNRTSVIVAHRLSTIVECDLICVLSQGSLVEKGTHSELLSLRGEYFTLWSKQES